MARIQKSLEILIHFKRFFLKSRVLATFWGKGGRLKNTLFVQIQMLESGDRLFPLVKETREV